MDKKKEELIVAYLGIFSKLYNEPILEYRYDTDVLYLSEPIKKLGFDTCVIKDFNKGVKEGTLLPFKHDFSIETPQEFEFNSTSQVTYSYITQDEIPGSVQLIITFIQSEEEGIRCIGRLVKEVLREKNQLVTVDTINRDFVTGLLTEKALEERINTFLKTEGRLSVHMFLLIEISNFENLLDNLGFSFGNELMEKISEIYSSVFRGTDIIGRLDDKTFVIFGKGIDDRRLAKRRCNEIISLLAEFSELLDSMVETNMAGVFFHKQGNNYSSLLKAATTMLNDVRQDETIKYKIS
jgi:diguanylate cyclase (GGDEF)-like protein